MNKTILIVDDSGSFRMVVKISLERAGYQVIEAGTGEQALLLLNGQTIDLVICDLNMPGMDGLSLARHLNDTPYRNTPVIMLTTETSGLHLDRAKELGIRAWLTKPFQPTHLLDTVAKLCAV